MTLHDQILQYWQIQQYWHDPKTTVTQEITFGKAVQVLRAIIDAPKNPRILLFAKLLLNDIVVNTVSPEVPAKIVVNKSDSVAR